MSTEDKQNNNPGGKKGRFFRRDEEGFSKRNKVAYPESVTGKQEKFFDDLNEAWKALLNQQTDDSEEGSQS